jgi:hypothetical protein
MLSILAKDILIVLVSTISSESAFNLCAKVLKEHRWSLSPEHVEMLSLIKDLEQDDARQQHNMKNKELKEKMANLYLDGYGPDGPMVMEMELVLVLELESMTMQVVGCTLFPYKILASRFYLQVFNEAAYFVTNNSFL